MTSFWFLPTRSEAQLFSRIDGILERHSKKENTEMKNPKRVSKRNRVVDVKAAAANDTSIVERLSPEQIIANDEKAPVAPDAPVSARTAAIRRSQAGKFNKVVLTQIGGTPAAESLH